jgi:carbon-monoxide dehydrogenase iron sulfur subunit
MKGVIPMIRFVEEKCFGCHLCEVACSGERLGYFNPRKATLHICYDYVGDTIEVKGQTCDLCGECEKACPVEAIKKVGGHYEVDPELCTSCLQCVEACPEKVISVADDHPVICNLCAQCVNWCPREALVLEGGAA